MQLILEDSAMTSRRATNNAKALDAFITTKIEIDAMLERLKHLNDDHFNIHPDEINWDDAQGRHADCQCNCHDIACSPVTRSGERRRLR